MNRCRDHLFATKFLIPAVRWYKEGREPTRKASYIEWVVLPECTDNVIFLLRITGSHTAPREVVQHLTITVSDHNLTQSESSEALQHLSFHELVRPGQIPELLSALEQIVFVDDL